MEYKLSKCIIRGKRFITAVLMLNMIIMTSCMFGACGKETADENKIGELKFEVIPDDKLPDELKTIINERKGEMFKTTYTDENNLYIIVGYGKQPTGGYSISVSELYETKNGIHFKTEFLGPSKSENVTQTVTYPYIVVKLEYTDKSVVFK